MESLSAANTQFSLNLFKKISEKQTGNVFFSPLSMSSALNMLSLGARGNTQAQILQVLCLDNVVKPDNVTPAPTPPIKSQSEPFKVPEFPKPQTPACTRSQSELFKVPEFPKPQILTTIKALYEYNSSTQQEHYIHSSYNKLMSELNKPGVPYALSLANRLYGEQTYRFVDQFLSYSKKYYQAGLETVDFIYNAEAARVNINNWVLKNTQGKIKDLLKREIINNFTRLVLVNAIYFKGNWDKKFQKEATVEQQFKLNKNQTKPVKMMNLKSNFSLTFIQEVSSQILELPYVGKNLSMLIILPYKIEDSTTGLQKLEKTLTYEKLMEWTKQDKMSLQEVEISLPKFKLEETYDMKSLLQSLGMVDAFETEKANFSGMSSSMSSSHNLVLTEVIHKSFVEVNEEGTEASAATGAVMGIRSIPLIFTADHPFLFFIRHNPSKSILFYGRFCSP